MRKPRPNPCRCHCGNDKRVFDADCAICRELGQGPEAAEREAALQAPKFAGPIFVLKSREKKAS
jgi:hypothetical protein